jgi:hypothetical protein
LACGSAHIRASNSSTKIFRVIGNRGKEQG